MRTSTPHCLGLLVFIVLTVPAHSQPVPATSPTPRAVTPSGRAMHEIRPVTMPQTAPVQAPPLGCPLASVQSLRDDLDQLGAALRCARRRPVHRLPRSTPRPDPGRMLAARPQTGGTASSNYRREPAPSPGNDGAIIRQELASARPTLDSVDTGGTLRIQQVQQVMEQITKTATLLSNVQRKMSDTIVTVLQNTK